jgi:hypothetical protein
MSFQPAFSWTKAMTPHAIHESAMANKATGFDGRLPARTGPSIGALGRRGRRGGVGVGRSGDDRFGGVTRPLLRFRSATLETVPGEA